MREAVRGDIERARERRPSIFERPAAPPVEVRPEPPSDKLLQSAKPEPQVQPEPEAAAEPEPEPVVAQAPEPEPEPEAEHVVAQAPEPAPEPEFAEAPKHRRWAFWRR